MHDIAIFKGVVALLLVYVYIINAVYNATLFYHKSCYNTYEFVCGKIGLT